MKFEIVTNYYDRKSRKNVRHVHGIVEADNSEDAATEGRKLYGEAACKLDGHAHNEFNAKRSIKVIDEVQAIKVAFALASITLLSINAEILKSLESLIKIYEQDDETTTPGTDSYTAMTLAKIVAAKARGDLVGIIRGVR